MNCLKIREKISSYMDGELDSEQSRCIDRHLLNCTECQEEMRLLQQIDASIREMPSRSPSSRFSEHLMQNIPGRAAVPGRDSSVFDIFMHPLKFFEKFYNLFTSQRISKTATFDEFGDFPPGSMGSIYFKLFAINR